MRARGRVWIGILAVVAAIAVAAAFTRRPPAPPSRPLDRMAAWKTLGMKGSLEQFEAQVAGLRSVVLAKPPVVGQDYHPVFPPDVPFDPRQWRTDKPSPSLANPNAPQGGTLRLSIQDWPPTVRTEGPNSRLSTLSDIQILVYEPLLNYDMALDDYTPALADDWQILPDRRTFRFHLNPKARWADGRPVTSDDVKATFEHLRRADVKDPEIKQFWDERIDSVRVIDRHIVEIRGKKPYWRTMLEVSGQLIYPAAYIRMPGDVYLTDWNYRLPPGTGPYELRPEDLVKGESITLRRRPDYWDQDDPNVKGTYNFAAVRWDVIRDTELTYQKFLAGELDAYLVLKAQRWVDELERERSVQMGWVQRRKIYEREPQGYGGFAFNMRKAPFDDLNVRHAFACLFNRDLLFAKFFYFQYDMMDSYFPGQIYARPDARPVRYQPDQARALLAQAGWTLRDADGYLTRADGQRFPILELDNSSGPAWTRIFQVVQNDLWQQAGIQMNLVDVDSPSLLKKIWDNQFQLVFWMWTSQIFPDMEFQFGSKSADMPQSNNLNGFKSADADAIFAKYKLEFDAKKRVKMMQRLDEILFQAHPYALSWYAPYYRIIWWDKFGYPPEYGDRYVGSLNNIIRYWWMDPRRWQATQDHKARGLPNHPDRPGHQAEAVDQRYWLSHPLPMTPRPWSTPGAGP